MQSQKWNDNGAFGEFAKSRLYYPFVNMRIDIFCICFIFMLIYNGKCSFAIIVGVQYINLLLTFFLIYFSLFLFLQLMWNSCCDYLNPNKSWIIFEGIFIHLKLLKPCVFVYRIEICVMIFFFFSSPNIIGLYDKGRQRIAEATPYKSATYR